MMGEKKGRVISDPAFALWKLNIVLLFTELLPPIDCQPD